MTQRHARIGHIKLKQGFLPIGDWQGRVCIHCQATGDVHPVSADFRMMTWTGGPMKVQPANFDHLRYLN